MREETDNIEVRRNLLRVWKREKYRPKLIKIESKQQIHEKLGEWVGLVKIAWTRNREE